MSIARHAFGPLGRLTVPCRALLAVIAAVTLAAACQDPPPRGPVYTQVPPHSSVLRLVLAIHPLYNPVALFRVYQPLVDYLNKRVPGVSVSLLASRDYADYLSKVRSRSAALLLPNPWQTLQAQKVGYRVVAMAGDPNDFKGIMLARRDDTTLQRPSDLRGAVVAYPAPTAVAACILPQLWLQEHGVAVMTELTNQYVGSQEASILAVLLKQARLGATWPPPWRLYQRDHPAEAAQLRVAFETEPVANNSIMVRDDVAEPVAQALRQALLQLGDSAEGQAVLAGMETGRFSPADDATYAKVAEVIERFERVVRKVEAP